MEIEEVNQNNTDHNLSEEVKYVVVFYKKQGNDNKATPKLVFENYDRKIYPSSVKNIWRKYQRLGTVENHWSVKGRQKVLNEEDVEEIKEIIAENPSISSQEICNSLETAVSRQSVNKTLQDLNQKAYKLAIKTVLSINNINERLKFARGHRKWRGLWRKVIFSDEPNQNHSCYDGRTLIRKLTKIDNKALLITNSLGSYINQWRRSISQNSLKAEWRQIFGYLIKRTE